MTTSNKDAIGLYAASNSNPAFNPPVKYQIITYSGNSTYKSANIS
jgi:hypothetical protein